MIEVTRRAALGLSVALALGGAVEPRDAAAFEAIRATIGGRLGVAALDTGSGRRVGFGEDARFALCSTFKLPLAAAVLAQVDRGLLRLDRPVRFRPADLLDHAPAVRAHLATWSATVEQLCAGAVTLSDNSAANLLLPLVGGPAGLTRFCRAQGDAATRLDRTEPSLNTNLPGDPRDTTTPDAIVALSARLLTGWALSAEARARLIGWMEASTTGARRLRAGLPSGWRAGDKTGTGARGSVNDVCVAWPPGRSPIVIACYIDAPDAPLAACESAHAAVARIVAGRFA